MKYFINLIKRKQFSKLIFPLVFTLIGIVVLCECCKDLMDVGILFSENFINTFLSNVRWTQTILGVVCLYIGLIYLPCIIPESQDDSDYTVESRGDKIYVKFKNLEFLVDKKDLNITSFIYFDKNKKFVSFTRGNQIYAYVKGKHRLLTEKEIDYSRMIEEKDIFSKLDNAKVMTENDKLEYIRHNKIRKSYRPIMLIISLGILALSIVITLASIPKLFDYSNSKNNIEGIIVLISGCVGIAMGVDLLKDSAKEKELYKKIINNKMYIVDFYSYDKRIRSASVGDSGSHYEIKVVINNYYLDKWFRIPYKIYNENDIIYGKLVFFEDPTIGEVDLMV